MIVLIVQFVCPSSSDTGLRQTKPSKQADIPVTRVPGERPPTRVLQLKVSYITCLAQLIPPCQANCVGCAQLALYRSSM